LLHNGKVFNQNRVRARASAATFIQEVPNSYLWQI
jgi:hypothetical protein